MRAFTASRWSGAKPRSIVDACQAGVSWMGICLDFWTRELGLPIVELKREIAQPDQPAPGMRRGFLQALQESGAR